MIAGREQCELVDDEHDGYEIAVDGIPAFTRYFEDLGSANTCEQEPQKP